MIEDLGEWNSVGARNNEPSLSSSPLPFIPFTAILFLPKRRRYISLPPFAFSASFLFHPVFSHSLPAWKIKEKLYWHNLFHPSFEVVVSSLSFSFALRSHLFLLFFSTPCYSFCRKSLFSFLSPFSLTTHFLFYSVSVSTSTSQPFILGCLIWKSHL